MLRRFISFIIVIMVISCNIIYCKSDNNISIVDDIIKYIKGDNYFYIITYDKSKSNSIYKRFAIYKYDLVKNTLIEKHVDTFSLMSDVYYSNDCIWWKCNYNKFIYFQKFNILKDQYDSSYKYKDGSIFDNIFSYNNVNNNTHLNDKIKMKLNSINISLYDEPIFIDVTDTLFRFFYCTSYQISYIFIKKDSSIVTDCKSIESIKNDEKDAGYEFKYKICNGFLIAFYNKKDSNICFNLFNLRYKRVEGKYIDSVAYNNQIFILTNKKRLFWDSSLIHNSIYSDFVEINNKGYPIISTQGNLVIINQEIYYLELFIYNKLSEGTEKNHFFKQKIIVNSKDIFNSFVLNKSTLSCEFKYYETFKYIKDIYVDLSKNIFNLIIYLPDFNTIQFTKINLNNNVIVGYFKNMTLPISFSIKQQALINNSIILIENDYSRFLLLISKIEEDNPIINVNYTDIKRKPYDYEYFTYVFEYNYDYKNDRFYFTVKDIDSKLFFNILLEKYKLPADKSIFWSKSGLIVLPSSDNLSSTIDVYSNNSSIKFIEIKEKCDISQLMLDFPYPIDFKIASLKLWCKYLNNSTSNVTFDINDLCIKECTCK